MNQITIFTYENTSIRAITTEDGAPLFCGKDIATTLGYIDPKDALDRHCRGVSIRYPSSTTSDAHRKHASSPKATSTG